jgi:hypothetical protein
MSWLRGVAGRDVTCGRVHVAGRAAVILPSAAAGCQTVAVAHWRPLAVTVRGRSAAWLMFSMKS